MGKGGQQSAAEIGAEAERFRTGFRSVVMATVSAAGEPDASYAPYIAGIADADHCFFVCVSGLARHTRNLAETAQADLLFLQDEGVATNLFARVRLSYACRAEPIAHETSEWVQVMNRFERGFGDIVAVLRALPDFRVFRLVPLSGRYVRGFGQAYRLEGPDWSEARPLRSGPPDPAR